MLVRNFKRSWNLLFQLLFCFYFFDPQVIGLISVLTLKISSNFKLYEHLYLCYKIKAKSIIV